jgi:hypothetical protein
MVLGVEVSLLGSCNVILFLDLNIHLMWVHNHMFLKPWSMTCANWQRLTVTVRCDYNVQKFYLCIFG